MDFSVSGGAFLISLWIYLKWSLKRASQGRGRGGGWEARGGAQAVGRWGVSLLNTWGLSVYSSASPCVNKRKVLVGLPISEAGRLCSDTLCEQKGMRAHLSHWGLALAFKGLPLEAGFIWTWLIGLKDSRYVSRGHISNSYRAYDNKYTQTTALKLKATYTGLRDPEAERDCGVRTREEICSFTDTFLSHWLHYLFILLLRILIWRIMWGRGLKLKCLLVSKAFEVQIPFLGESTPPSPALLWKCPYGFPSVFAVCLLIWLVLLWV